MQNYTITPIITGYTHTNKATYLYHHSINKYYDTEGFLDLQVTIFLVQGNGHKILIDTYLFFLSLGRSGFNGCFGGGFGCRCGDSGRLRRRFVSKLILAASGHADAHTECKCGG